jgi:hypothetical protein
MITIMFPRINVPVYEAKALGAWVMGDVVYKLIKILKWCRQ